MGAGSIPACAGEPAIRDCRSCPARVYPRVCGGTALAPGYAVFQRGLSPRVRGNRVGRLDTEEWDRSIPACAGEPPGGNPARAGGRVYPRVCGGTAGWQSRARWWQGLSPRVRGNQTGLFRTYDSTGSIPACAGEPRGGGQIGGVGRVYPRVCGGTSGGVGIAGGGQGLSPRVRGNLALVR